MDIDNCNICSNPLPGEKGIVDCCRIISCFECIYEWSIERTDCPSCYKQFSRIYKVTEKKESVSSSPPPLEDLFDQEVPSSQVPRARLRRKADVDKNSSNSQSSQKRKDQFRTEKSHSSPTLPSSRLSKSVSHEDSSSIYEDEDCGCTQNSMKRSKLTTSSPGFHKSNYSNGILSQSSKSMSTSISKFTIPSSQSKSTIPSSQPKSRKTSKFYVENSQPSPVFRDNFVINNNKKPSSSDQFEAMRQFTRSSLKDITNIKKTSTPSQKEFSTPSQQLPIAETSMEISMINDSFEMQPTTLFQDEHNQQQIFQGNDGYDQYEVQQIESEPSNQDNNNFAGEDNANFVDSYIPMSQQSNVSDQDLMDLAPTQLSQGFLTAIAGSISIDEGLKRELHTYQTLYHVRTLLEPLYQNSEISKEAYKSVAKAVTFKFIGEMNNQDLCKPLILSPTRKNKIMSLLNDELTSVVILQQTLVEQ